MLENLLVAENEASRKSSAISDAVAMSFSKVIVFSYMIYFIKMYMQSKVAV